MRNWNTNLPRSFSIVSASRLPMRNWNTRSTETFHPRLNRFQTTYEELKLINATPATIPAIASFQTTYEELKPCRFGGWCCSWSRLPDYLWGIETVFDAIADGFVVLPDYLWGIETWLSCSIDAGTHSASRLPMRNWNPTWEVAGCRVRCGFQTTYEELKPLDPYRAVIKPGGFQTTYEELKLSSYIFP